MIARTARGAKTLSADYYTSGRIFENERDRVFGRKWLYAGRSSQLPPESGRYLVYRNAFDSVLLVRGRDGGLRGFHNVCRHRGTMLREDDAGVLANCKIRCPYHAWTWSLEGDLLAAPAMSGEEGFKPEDFPLHPVSVAEWEGFIFMSLAAEPEPFEAAYAPLLGKFSAWDLPELAVAHRTDYQVAANWKLLFQNYSECYHCPMVHPHLNKLTPFRDSTNDLEEGPFLGGPMTMSRDGGSMTSHGGRCAVPMPGISPGALDKVFYYTLFPGMFLSLHPDYVLVHRCEPLAVDRTRVVCEWLFHPQAMAEPGFDPTPAVEFWDLTNRQDWGLCEGAQRGISCRGYQPGPYAALESQLAAFDREYLRVLGPG